MLRLGCESMECMFLGVTCMHALRAQKEEIGVVMATGCAPHAAMRSILCVIVTNFQSRLLVTVVPLTLSQDQRVKLNTG